MALSADEHIFNFIAISSLSDLKLSLSALCSFLIYGRMFQVPRSSKKLYEDNEYALYTVTLFRRVADNFRTSSREKGFQVSLNYMIFLKLHDVLKCLSDMFLWFEFVLCRFVILNIVQKHKRAGSRN